MRLVVLAHPVDWGGFRAAARALALEGVAPGAVEWAVREPDDLFTAPAEAASRQAPGSVAFTLPRALVDLAQAVIQAREPARLALLYRLIHRTHAGERRLLEQADDADVAAAARLARSVAADTHRMRALLRWREDGKGLLRAWYEPAHFIAEANADRFVERLGEAPWSLNTPYRGLHWDGAALAFGPGGEVGQPGIVAAASRYWRNLPAPAALPEPTPGAEIMRKPGVVWRAAPGRRARTDADDRLAQAAAEAADCRRCPLWKPATQTVWGEGPADAAIMFIGEQPGDQEDQIGRPFVGPAGQLFDRALDEAGLDRATVYVTNAVKHFKFEPRGKRRIHAKPDATEIEACAPWLDIERTSVMPRLTVLMGATAARAVLGRVVGITRERGRPMPLGNGQALVTVHPSYLLRLPDEAAKAREYAAFVGDLRLAAKLAA